MNKFKPSAKLTDDENSRLKTLESLLSVAPLLDAKYAEYKTLCKKAGRKPHSNCDCV